MEEKFECAYKKLVDIDTLVENPKNNNKHPEKQIEMLAKIIKFQGQRSPIVVSNRSGFIVKGHGRLQALKKLGYTKVAVDYQDYESEAQEYADMIADNKISELAEFDKDMFMAELTNIDIDDAELFGRLELPEIKVEEESVEEKEKNYIIQYNIIFDDEEQQNIWYEFVKNINLKYADCETFAERLTMFINGYLENDGTEQ